MTPHESLRRIAEAARLEEGVNDHAVDLNDFALTLLTDAFRAAFSPAECLRLLDDSELLMDAWIQWAYVPSGFAEMSLDVPRHDGGLSTLEDIREALVRSGRLMKYDGRPEMDWYVCSEPSPRPPEER